jgi:methylphosphotriester-DNA--protein-cysteine methyltransferase
MTVPQLAAHAHMAPRTFARRFVAETGTTPLRWLLDARLDNATRSHHRAPQHQARSSGIPKVRDAVTRWRARRTYALRQAI